MTKQQAIQLHGELVVEEAIKICARVVGKALFREDWTLGVSIATLETQILCLEQARDNIKRDLKKGIL